MKWIIFFLSMICTTVNYAQVIKRDTIKLRGYVYDEQGTPVKHTYIQSTQYVLDSDRNYPIGIYTDTCGYFELQGIKFNDTLTFDKEIPYTITPIYNKGSRYIVIHLVRKENVDSSAVVPVLISAVRKYTKLIPTFKLEFNPGFEPRWLVYQQAKFPGGLSRFYELIKTNLMYPEKAVENNIEGTVTLKFDIERDGTATHFQVVRGLGYGCEEQLISIIKKLPKWLPLITNGRTITSAQTVSVEFKLTDK